MHPVLVTDCLVSVGKLAWFLMCTVLVTETVVYLVSEGGLAWFLTCTVLVTETVACLVFQDVSWAAF